MDNKSNKLIKVLAYSDAGSARTGFGVVSRYILSALHNTGKYHIEQLAINHPARFVDTAEVPWQQIPARMLDPAEPYGKKMFLRTVLENDYDIVWILNDTYVTYDIAGRLKQVLQQKKSRGQKIPKIIYYYPVDCHVQENVSDMIKLADVPVCYNDYGRTETLKAIPEVLSKLRQIPHGTDLSIYHPLSAEARRFLKAQYLHNNADKFLFLNINRNSDRKQITRTILAFSEFKKIKPNSILLLHTMPIDHSMGRTIDLFAAIKDLGLSLTDDVLLPKNYEPSRPFPDKVMNELYNIADCFITTSLGEGHGITLTDSLAAGTPAIAPDNTNVREILGDCEERGYVYLCKDRIWADNAGYRKIGYLQDIVEKMLEAHDAGDKMKNPRVAAALSWTQKNTWDSACSKWIELFEEVLRKPAPPEVSRDLMLEDLNGDLL